jgi:hypothetical protein
VAICVLLQVCRIQLPFVTDSSWLLIHVQAGLAFASFVIGLIVPAFGYKSRQGHPGLTLSLQVFLRYCHFASAFGIYSGAVNFAVQVGPLKHPEPLTYYNIDLIITCIAAICCVVGGFFVCSTPTPNRVATLTKPQGFLAFAITYEIPALLYVAFGMLSAVGFVSILVG